jgi:hypothetical protein
VTDAVSVPLIHPRKGVTARVDAEDWAEWQASGRDTRWIWEESGPHFLDADGHSAPVADAIAGAPVRFATSNTFDLRRANLARLDGRPHPERNPMTKTTAPETASEEREFGAGTIITHVEGVVSVGREADEKRHLRTESVTLADGTVLETVHGVDFSIRIMEDRRDRSAVD